MKLLLQNSVTKLFYRGGEVWTPDPDQAFDFQHSQGLPEFTEKLDLVDAELVVRFEDTDALRSCGVE